MPVGFFSGVSFCWNLGIEPYHRVHIVPRHKSVKDNLTTTSSVSWVEIPIYELKYLVPCTGQASAWRSASESGLAELVISFYVAL